jgi:hypothetical protein
MTAPTSLRGRIATILGAVLVIVAAVPVANASSPVVHLALSVAPNPSIDGQQVTWKGVVTPVGGTVATVSVHMEGAWFSIGLGVSTGTCAPAASCHTDTSTGNAYWTLKAVSRATTITYTTQARTGGTIRLYDDGGAGCDTSCPATASLRPPTGSVSVGYTASGYPVMPGTTLHVRVTGTTDKGPLEADLQGLLGLGLADPTAIVPVGPVYSLSYRYMDDAVTLQAGVLSVLTFDTVVTAAVGTDVTLTGNLFPSGYTNRTSTIKVHVGPVSTVYQENDGRIHHTGTWTRAASSTASGGHVGYATRAGASATLSFMGLGFAWVAPVGPTRGSARVYVDDVYRKTVSLYRSAVHTRVTVFSATWTTPGTHSIRIVVLGTAGHPRVDVDALIVRS